MRRKTSGKTIAANSSSTPKKLIVIVATIVCVEVVIFLAFHFPKEKTISAEQKCGTQTEKLKIRERMTVNEAKAIAELKRCDTTQRIRQKVDHTLSPKLEQKDSFTTLRGEISKGWSPEAMDGKMENVDQQIGVTSTSDFTWKTITKNLRIFSSYLDQRYLITKKGTFNNSLVIFGYELGPTDQSVLKCVVIMGNGSRIVLRDPAVREILAERWARKVRTYRAFMYRCNLMSIRAPRYVTLYYDGKYSTSLPFEIFIPVVDPRSTGAEHQFGVCYQTPLYGNYDQEIIDSIEMNKLLGASWFTIYVYEAHDKAMKIFRHYVEKEEILDAVFNWKQNLPSPTYNRGLLAGLNDCGYRNMYKVRYLILCDLDELIIPAQSLHWQGLLSKIDTPERGFFVFQHVGFTPNITKSPKFKCPGQNKLTYNMPLYLSTFNRTAKPMPARRNAKSIAEPVFSLVFHVHGVRNILPGYTVYVVPTNVGLMLHFRSEDNYRRFKDYRPLLDRGMERFKPALLAAVERQICENPGFFQT